MEKSGHVNEEGESQNLRNASHWLPAGFPNGKPGVYLAFQNVVSQTHIEKPFHRYT